MTAHPSAHLNLLERLETAYASSQKQIETIKHNIELINSHQPTGFEIVLVSLESSLHFVKTIDADIFNLLHSIEGYNMDDSEILKEIRTKQIAEFELFKRVDSGASNETV